MALNDSNGREHPIVQILDAEEGTAPQRKLSDGDSNLSQVTTILEEDERTIIPSQVVVVASMRTVQRRLALGVLTFFVISAFVVSRTMCRARDCGEGSGSQRAQEILRLVNEFSLQASNLTYPPKSHTMPEDQALDFLIQHDALQLSATADASRLLQRYALAVMWFSNGPWTSDDAEFRSQDAAKRAWFVGPEECLWTGVSCEDRKITGIRLESQGAKGTLPLDLALLTGLTSLRLRDNRLTGTIPTFFSEFSNLKHLDVSVNDLTGPLFPTFLTELTSLAEFSVGWNNLHGSIPNVWTNMTQLTAFSVGANSLTGTVPSSFLSELTALTHLGLGGSHLTGTLPQSLGRLTDLEFLDVSGLEVSAEGAFLPSLSDLRKLTHLSCSQAPTLMDGFSLPSEIGEWWPDMHVFSVVRTNLVGSIPDSVARWASLTEFDVSSNALTGSLPREVYSSWSELESFDVGWNEFRGIGVPFELGLIWKQLKVLDIRHNQFSGPLPTTLSQLSHLSKFIGTSNRMTGEIPPVFPSYATVWLDSNNFSGTAPFCDGNRRSAVLTQNRVDCKTVQCDCCVGCT